MIYLSPGSSIQINVVPKPMGVPTSIAQVDWTSSAPETATAQSLASDATGRTGVLTASKTAKPDAAADITWRYKNTNGEVVASSLLTVRIVRPVPVDQTVTGAELRTVGDPVLPKDDVAAKQSKVV